MFDVLDRITELRNERGWSNYRVAKSAGISQSTYQTWYSRKASPTLEGIEKVCRAFDISLSEFFYEGKKKLVEYNLGRIRNQKGISMEELAEKSGVPFEYIFAFENGKMNLRNAAYSTVESIARVLGCGVEEIVEAKDEED